MRTRRLHWWWLRPWQWAWAWCRCQRSPWSCPCPSPACSPGISCPWQCWLGRIVRAWLNQARRDKKRQPFLGSLVNYFKIIKHAHFLEGIKNPQKTNKKFNIRKTSLDSLANSFKTWFCSFGAKSHVFFRKSDKLIIISLVCINKS